MYCVLYFVLRFVYCVKVTGRPKHEYVEKKHFQHSYTCIGYGAASTSKKRKDSQDSAVVALGTSDGKVILWDLKRGVVAHILGSVRCNAEMCTLPMFRS